MKSEEESSFVRFLKAMLVVGVAVVLLGLLLYFTFSPNSTIGRLNLANIVVGCLFGYILGKFLVKVESYKFSDLSTLAGVVGIGAMSKLVLPNDAVAFYFIAVVAGFLLHMILYILLGGDVQTVVKKSSN